MLSFRPTLEEWTTQLKKRNEDGGLLASPIQPEFSEQHLADFPLLPDACTVPESHTAPSLDMIASDNGKQDFKQVRVSLTKDTRRRSSPPWCLPVVVWVAIRWPARLSSPWATPDIGGNGARVKSSEEDSISQTDKRKQKNDFTNVRLLHPFDPMWRLLLRHILM